MSHIMQPDDYKHTWVLRLVHPFLHLALSRDCKDHVCT